MIVDETPIEPSSHEVNVRNYRTSYNNEQNPTV